MDISCLRDAGLTQGEIKVYLALIEIGFSTVGPILEQSGVTKSIIYHILDRLIAKGLVSFVFKEKTRYYQASLPEKLLDYVEENEKMLSQSKEQIRRLIPELYLKLSRAGKTQATIYQGFKGLMTVHDKRYEKLHKGDDYFFFGLPAQQPEYMDAYWQRDHRKRAELGISCKLLYNQRAKPALLENRNRFRLCDARLMPIDVDTPAWILGYKDVTVIGIPLADTPFAFEIVNQDVVDSFRSYFTWFWNKSRKFRTRSR